MDEVFTQRAEGYRLEDHDEEPGIRTLVLLGRSEDDAPTEIIGKYEVPADLWDAMKEERQFVPA